MQFQVFFSGFKFNFCKLQFFIQKLLIKFIYFDYKL
jgi:hypothetical protein